MEIKWIDDYNCFYKVWDETNLKFITYKIKTKTPRTFSNDFQIPRNGSSPFVSIEKISEDKYR